MMTRKHFEAIAEAVADVRYDHECNDRITSNRYLARMIDLAISNLVGNLSDLCQRDNPNFDREKFLKACGQ